MGSNMSTSAVSPRRDAQRILRLLTPLALAWVAMLVCGYRFGVNDQAQYLVQYLALQQPGAFADDPYLLAFDALGSVFWSALATLLPTDVNLPLILLLITLAIAAINARLLMALGATTIGEHASPRARNFSALLAALLFVTPKEQNWLGLVSLADVELTATLAAVPLALGAMLAWVRARPWIALACALGAMPLHGQTGLALCAAWTLAALLEWRTRPRLVLLPLALGIMGFAGVSLLWFHGTLPAAETRRLGAIGHALYPELIDPTTLPLKSWLGLAFVLALGVASARLLWHRSVGARRLATWALLSLAFPVGGTLLHAIGVDHPLLWKLMVGRGFMLAQIASFILIAGAGVTLLTDTSLARTLRVRPAFVLAFMLTVIAWPVAWKEPRTHFPMLSSGHDPAWLDAQQWARAHTAPGALFVTPPYLSDWRVASRRPTFGEVKDGCLFFYDPDHAFQWADRMSLLGVPDTYPFREARHTVRPDADRRLASLRQAYHDAVITRINDIACGHTPIYIVAETAADIPLGDEVWCNHRFVIRCLSEPTPSYVLRTP